MAETRMCTLCKHRPHRARGLCDTCYKIERRKAVREGTWRSTRPPMVDGAAAAQHLDRLAKAGVSRWQVITLTGLLSATVYAVQPGRSMLQKTATKILSVPIPGAAHLLVTDRAFVPSCGTTRRLQALCALGWPIAVLADRLGDNRGHLAEICRGERAQVIAYTALTVSGLYDELQGQLGPSDRVRVAARKRGWAPPLAWALDDDEDNQIDDPDAKPQGLRGGQRPSFKERYNELVALGYTSPAMIAQAMNISELTLARQLAPSKSGRTA